MPANRMHARPLEVDPIGDAADRAKEDTVPAGYAREGISKDASGRVGSLQNMCIAIVDKRRSHSVREGRGRDCRDKANVDPRRDRTYKAAGADLPARSRVTKTNESPAEATALTREFTETKAI